MQISGDGVVHHISVISLTFLGHRLDLSYMWIGV